MAETRELEIERQPTTDWVAVARALGPALAARAAAHDEADRFVADNYADLRARRLFSAGVPAELGGGGAAYAELCAMLRTLAHFCTSTALALSMHTHQVVIPAWRWRHQGAPVAPFLERVARGELVVVTSGGSDFLASSGAAVRADGGWRVTARKRFASGAPAGDLFATSAVHDDPRDGPTVLHFVVPLRAPGVTIVESWRALGMRGTGSHDVVLEDVLVPDAAVGVRRPAGRWSAAVHLIFMLAIPLIYAVYVGLAEAARDLALGRVADRRQEAGVQQAVGELENAVATARMALRHMIEAAGRGQPGPATTNEVAIGRTIAGRAALRTVELAMEMVGGAAFFRTLGLERLFRDAQGARYHPMREPVQLRYTGRLALGLAADG